MDSGEKSSPFWAGATTVSKTPIQYLCQVFIPLNLNNVMHVFCYDVFFKYWYYLFYFDLLLL